MHPTGSPRSVMITVAPALTFGADLAEERTVRHFHPEIWLPSPAWTRQT